MAAFYVFLFMVAVCVLTTWVIVRETGWDWVTFQPPEQAITAPIYRIWHSRRQKLERQIKK